ncbi:hypothetical protein HZH68_010558 [Vespula germanica]|uniref:alpha-glucosidase n=1 Tax=Vespula germanica TaxID=30212 RepID=A0A834N3K9_VESGE|nr:hypothetical protein HZH68_010558 [Vespula germanica]
MKYSDTLKSDNYYILDTSKIKISISWNQYYANLFPDKIQHDYIYMKHYGYYCTTDAKMFRTVCFCSLLLATGLVHGEIKNKGWWRNAVFYQIYPRSFMDSNDDGVGDLKGITSKLEHFVDAGVRGIWLSPIYASPMIDFGYDISDFKAIHPEFGTMEDFETLVAKSKKLGLKVILDLVPNHTSDKHEWFQKYLAGEEKYKDYYIWRKGRKDDGVTPPNNWISDVIRFWLRKGVDGFRIDAVPHLFEIEDLRDEPRSSDPSATDRDYTYLNHIYTKDDPRTYELVQSWRNLLDDYSDANNEDEKVMMTEAYTSLENTTKYYEYGSHIPFNFKLITDVNHNSSATDFKRIIETWMAHTPNTGSANWVLGNHDRSRTASRYPKRAVQMTMLPMILPGVAVTYYGEEIGMVDKSDISWEDTQDPQACNAGKDKYQSRSRDPNRTPFQWDNSKNAGFSKGNRTWLPVHESYELLNLENQKNIVGPSVYKVYRSLIQLRNSSRALQEGNLRMDVVKFNTHFCYNCEMLVINREIPGESVTFFMSFSPVLDIFVELNKYMTLYNETYVEADGYYEERHKPYWNNLNLPPFEGAVVSSRN